MTASGSSSVVAVLNPVNPSIATTSTCARHDDGREVKPGGANGSLAELRREMKGMGLVRPIPRPAHVIGAIYLPEAHK